MLTLIVGSDRGALSKEVLNRICAAASAGKERLILVVPEQFSHEAERNLCLEGGDTISRYAEVLSFSRLSDRVAAEHGGAARAYLDKGGQLLTMALAAEQVSSRIKLYASVLRKPEFLSDMVRIVNEFRSYCLEPESLLRISKKTDGLFSQKLEEIGCLYEAYLAVCAKGEADPSEKLLRLRDTLVETQWAAGKSVYIDGFMDYTGLEMAVLEAILCQADVYVTFTIGERETVLSRLSEESARTLQRIAAKWEVPTKTEQVEAVIARTSGVQLLLDGLFMEGKCSFQISEDVSLMAFQSVEEECRTVVQRIRQLLQSGARCRDISVAYTDLALYETPLRAALRTAGLPAYYAGETKLLEKSIISALLNALSAAVGPMEYEDVAIYLKSSLPLLERNNCDRLDLYAYRWNLTGSQWEKPWELHPRGFGEAWTEEDCLLLQELNEKKTVALEPLLDLRKGLRAAGNTGDMVLALGRFLEKLKLRERLERQAYVLEKESNGQQAQELMQLYEILLQSLEQMWLILGRTSRTPDDFVRLYRLLLTQYRVGTIPAGLDQIHVSDLPDLRCRQSKHLFVLGASDGRFPAYKTTEGLLTEEERKRLAENGIAIAPNRVDQMEQEISRISSAMFAASETISLSYAGEQPAWLFRRAAEMFPKSVNSADGRVFLDWNDLAAWRIRHDLEMQTGCSELERVEAGLRSLRSYEFKPLQKKNVQGLYGKQISLSASRIDKYASCRFAFFLAYGLKAQPKKQAKMDPSVFGTFVHAVLERVVTRVMETGSFRTISRENLLELALDEINQYASLHFPEQAQRAVYLFRRSKQEILDIVMDLGEELRKSLFQPVSCELEFSKNGMLPPIEIQGRQATSLISGFVDRVDLFETDSKTFVRVVDYKTGKKDFDYTDILNGAGLQMLVYLFALRQFGGEMFQRDQLEPAGVLYLPARREYSLTEPMPDDETVEAGHREERRRKGLIRKDDVVLAAMEEDPQRPRFMPYEIGKQGIKGDLASPRQMILLERHVIRTLADMTDSIASGEVAPNPIVRGQYGSCRFCDFVSVCHRDMCRPEMRNLAVTSADKFWEKLEQEEESHG